MAEAYNSTDRRSVDVNPNTPRLIHEDTVYLGGFGSFDSGYIASTSIDISAYNQVKDVWAERGPSSLKIELVHVIREGSEFTFFQQAPYYRRYDNAGLKTAWCNFGALNQTDGVGDIFVSNLYIDYYSSANTILDKWSAYWTQEFRYKIWSTVF